MQDVMADMAANPTDSRIVLAHRRVDVRALNDDIRNARKEEGALSEEAPFATANGERQSAAGDRMVFLENDRTLGVKNGMLGTVERAGEGVLQVRLDAEGGPRQGRMVEVNQETYQAVDHGYATTIHKSQGATVDRAFVLASESMDKHLVYVGMTRHRAAATLYAGQDEFRDLDTLSDRLSRSNAKETTLDYAERRGLAPPSAIVLSEAYRAAAAAAERGQEASDAGHGPVDTLRAKVLAARERAEGSQALSPAAETPRDALRARLRRLDSLDLSQAMEANRTRDRGASVSREMTVADAARLILPAYAETADRLAEVRWGVAASDKAIRTYTQQRNHALDQGDARWKAMGTMRQYGHRTGVRPDPAMSTHEHDEASAAERLAAEEKRRDERMTMLPGLERDEAEALELVRPQAKAKLAELQERAEIAREVQQEKWQAQKEREQTRQRERGRERDLGIER